MKKSLIILALIGAAQAFASDHNNLEHQRPLLIEDAFSIAFGEREFQTGFSLSSFRNARPQYGYRSEFQYGFAKNQDISLAFDTSFGTGSDALEVSYFRNIQRELEHSPAVGFRLGYERQGGRNSVHGALAVTKAWHQYDKLHFNLRLDTLQTPGFVLGYSSPLGYPKSFDKTMLAEISYQGGSASVGVGFRRQLDAQAVLDMGVQAGMFSSSRSPIRLTIGYSIGF